MQLSTENLCNECPPNIKGSCCYFQLQLNGHIFTLTNHPCKYLNIKTRRCKVYHKRKKTNPNCLTLEEMYIQGGLPKKCLYVKDNLEYQKRTDVRDLIFIPSEYLEEYNDFNNAPHKEIGCYDTIRDPLCIKCKSPSILEEFDNKLSITYSEYECDQCGHIWNTFKRQIQFTLKLISRSSNLPKNQIQNIKSKENKKR